MSSLVQANVTFQGSITSLGTLGQTTYAPVDLGVNSLSLKTGNLTSLITTTSSAPTGFAAAGEGALVFPGTANAYISFGTTGQPFSNSNIYAFGDFVVEAWVNPANFTAVQYFINGGDPNTGSYWFLATNSSTGTLSWFSFLNGISASLNSTAALTAGTWQHVTVIHQSASKRLQLYINGQPQAITASGTGFSVSGTVGSYTNGIVPAVTNLVVGQNVANYNGSLTNLRIVTGSGAAQIYNNNAFTPSTTPLFPASNTAGGSLTTRLLVRVPLATSKMVVPKLGGANCNTVLAFPPAPMTGYSTNMTGQSYYGQGTYVASASSDTNGAAWQAFDKNTGTAWNTTNSTYTAGSPYSGSVVTVDVNGTSYRGEWLQIQQPSSIVLSNYYINPNGYPSIWYILGSRDGTNWFLVDQRTTTTAPGVGVTYTVSSPQAFTYFRMVVNLIYTFTTASIVEWTLNGQIEGPSISPDGRVGLGVTNPTQALEVAGSAVVAGTLSAGNPLMFRNRIINGDMRVAQRGTSNVGVFATPCYFVDRFLNYLSASGGGFTGYQNVLSVNDSGPYQQGFRYAANCVVTSTVASAVIGPSLHVIEGWNVQDFNWGTSYGSPATISYWFKSNATGTFSYGVRNHTNYTIAYTGSFTYSTAGVWQYVSYTVPPPPTGYAWQTGNLACFEVFLGGSFQNSAAPGWNAGASFGVAGSANWYVTGGYVAVTGVQLEKGSVATPYEIRPYATELALCQRYYVRFTGDGSFKPLGIATAINTTSATGIIVAPTSMRSQPTIIDISSSSNTCAYTSSMIQGTTTHTTNDVYLYSANLNLGFTTIGGTGNGVASLTRNLIGINLSNGSGLTAGGSGMLYMAVNKYIGFSAEL
jgi:hypothetical protein